MKLLGLNGILVPHTDEFGSEYPRAHDENLKWISGFTGSAGSAIVLENTAIAMTDSRYTIQIKEQVDTTLFQLGNSAEITPADWLLSNAVKPSVIGYDPKLYHKRQVDALIQKLDGSGITLKPLGLNLFAKIWFDRPAESIGEVELFPDEVAGATSAQKRRKIADWMSSDKIDTCVLTVADSICWLLNIRGRDAEYSPLVMSYALLHKDGTLDWYVDERKVTDEVRGALGEQVRIHAFDGFADSLRALKGVVQYDDARSSMWVYNMLGEGEAKIIFGKDPCVMPKACKTDAEQLSLKQAHIRDGVALTRLMFWLEAQDTSLGHVTELLVEEKLEEFRRAHRTYRGPGFSTIAGWAEHGAIVHYRATPETNKVITNNNFLLLDSGGQYEYGTTDITRTIVVGEVTPGMKEKFTRVLKAYFAIANARFAPETTGAALDNLGRQPLIDEGMNFGHGTGHGVGCFLCVHEESTGISPRVQATFRPGMLVSNEPGYYLEGQFGIRHENLLLCQEDEASGDYYFETVSVAPFDKRGIDWDLMTEAEIQALEDYHRFVLETLSPFLDDIELQWLQNTLFPEEKHEPTEEEVAFSYSAYD